VRSIPPLSGLKLAVGSASREGHAAGVEESPVSEPPGHLSLESHRDLAGRGHHIWIRRVQARFQIQALKTIKEPTLALDKGWLEAMTLNSVVPDAPRQDNRTDRTLLSFEPIHAGQSLTERLQLQVNPTAVGHRSQDVELSDGNSPIARVNRSVTIFP
jgi:hypothetical protein